MSAKLVAVVLLGTLGILSCAFFVSCVASEALVLQKKPSIKVQVVRPTHPASRTSNGQPSVEKKSKEKPEYHNRKPDIGSIQASLLQYAGYKFSEKQIEILNDDWGIRIVYPGFENNEFFLAHSCSREKFDFNKRSLRDEAFHFIKCLTIKKPMTFPADEVRAENRVEIPEELGFSAVLKDGRYVVYSIELFSADPAVRTYVKMNSDEIGQIASKLLTDHFLIVDDYNPVVLIEASFILEDLLNENYQKKTGKKMNLTYCAIRPMPESPFSP